MDPIREIVREAQDLGEEALACLDAYEHMSVHGGATDAVMNQTWAEYRNAIARIAALSRHSFERVDFEMRRKASRRRDRWRKLTRR